MGTSEVPVCLACWRSYWSMSEDPTRAVGFPEETCEFCGRRTNHGIYLPRSEPC